MQEITKLSLSEHLTSPVIFLQHFTQSSPRQMSSAGRRLDTKNKLFVYSAPTAVDQVASSLAQALARRLYSSRMRKGCKK